MYFYTIRLAVLLAIFILNLPFGFFRVRFNKFTRPWGRCIYLPILINILIRRFILHWDWTAIPYLFTAAVLGHLLGGLWGKRYAKKRGATETSSVN